MGCDIHIFREKLIQGRWVTADKWESDGDGDMYVPRDTRAFAGRNYELFGLLSRNVRSEHPYSFTPRGIPFNVCPEVTAQVERWDGDGHGHNHLYLHELREMRQHLDTVAVEIKGMKDAHELQALQATIDAGAPNWNLLYPYCGGTNAKSYVEFAMRVPASFCMGASLDRIIASFDGIDGDNHRIVFWFDN